MNRLLCSGRLVLAIAASMALVAACSGGPAPPTTEAPNTSPLSDVSEDELSALSEHFAPLTAELDDAKGLLGDGLTRDSVGEHIAAHYSATVVFQDPSFGDRTEGRDDLIGPTWGFLNAIGDASIEGDVYVGDPTALQRISYWGFEIDSLEFTESTPFIEVSLLTIEDDLIASQILFLDMETLSRIFGADIPDGVLQREYAEAWSSGESDRIAALYRSDAVRHDGLAGVEARGASDIRAEVERWMEHTNGATWSVSLRFAERTGRRVGAFYEVTSDGCTVEVGALFEVGASFDVDEGPISQETIHYDPESLRACGWVR